MRTFNSFQMVVGFVAWPFLISWLNEATFRGASVAFWAAIICYLAAFIGMVGTVRAAMELSSNKDYPWVWWNGC